MSKFLKLLFLFSFILLGFALKTSFAMAADRYWVGGTGTWDGSDTTHWSASSGGAGGASVPTSSDDVYVDANSGGGTITTAAGAAVRNLDFGGFTGTYTIAAGISTAISGSFTASSTMAAIATGNGSSVLAFTSTTGTSTITTAGVSMPRVTFSGAGGIYVLADNFTSTGLMTLTRGTLHIDGPTDNSGLTHSVGSFDISNSNVRELYMGNASITLTTGGANNWNVTTATNLTFNKGTATITLSGAAAAFTGNALSYPTVVFSGSGAATVGGAAGLAFVNLTRTGTAVKTDSISFGANFTVTGTLTLAGNSAINRLAVASNSLNSVRTITNSGATMTWSNVDFRDITLGTSYDCSAITGLCGDAGGNTNITFTTAADQHWTNADGGNWADSANWTSRVPLPQDNALIDTAFNSAKTVTINMPRIGKDIDFTGMTFSGTKPIFTYNAQGSITLYGSLTLQNSTNMTWTLGANMFLEGRGSHTLTCAGQNFAASATFQGPGSSWSLQDAFSATTNVTWTHGTLTTNNFSITALSLGRNNSNTVTYNLGTSTLTLTGTGSAWVFNGTGGTLNANTSTITLTNTTATAKTFSGGGYTTYGTVTFAGDNISVTGNNTIATLNLNNAGFANGVKFTGASTTTITSSLTTNATSTSARAIATSTNASIFELKYTGAGAVCVDYMTFSRALGKPTSVGTVIWYAGANSLDAGNNSGLSFTSCSTPASGSITYGVKIGPQGGTAPGWYATGGTWSYRKRITIDPTKLSTSATSTFSNFPLLVSVTDSDLKTTGNGGKVTDSGGLDILFTSSDGTTKLNREIEKYTATTGELVAWVSVPTLSASTAIYMYFGSAATDANSTSVWDSNYVGVWHLKESGNGTADEYADSTSNDNDAQGGGGTSTKVPAQATGKIGYSQDFSPNDPSDYILVPDHASLDNVSAAVTLEAWLYNDNSPTGWGQMIHRNDVGADELWSLFMESSASDDAYMCVTTTGQVCLDTGYSLGQGRWLHVVGVYDGANIIVYVNGVAVNSTAQTGSIPAETSGVTFGEGADAGNGEVIDGKLDEIRISSSARSADWIKTEYNNQNSPGTFYSYGAVEVQTRSTAFAGVNSRGASDIGWYATGGTWSYRKRITIDPTKLSTSATSTFSNFPLLVSVTDSDLKTTGNGGKVTDSGGLDILFTSSDGTTKLNREIEKYTATTGELVAWVSVPTLSASTAIYMYFGSAATDANSTSVWDSNYVGVWHLSESVANDGTQADSTSSNNDGTFKDADGDSSSGVAAKINGGDTLAADADDDYVLLPDMGTVEAYPFTFEIWVKTSALTTMSAIGQFNSGNTSIRVFLATFGAAGIPTYNVRNGGSEVQIDGPTTISDGRWHHFAGVSASATSHILYVDGISVGSSSGNVPAPSVDQADIGNWLPHATAYSWNGSLDEARISNTNRSADWIKTGYNNQNSPGTFYSYGAVELQNRPAGTPLIKFR